MSRRASRYGHTSRWRYVWLPSVRTSAPALKSSSAYFGVMPIPPAAFSPLTTTKSAPSSSRRLPSMVRAARRPAEPTTSPTNRIVVKTGTVVDLSPAGHTEGAMQEEHDRPGAGGVADPPAEPRPGHAPAPPRGEEATPVRPVVVPRWIQLVVLPLVILGAWALLRAAGPITLLFVVAGLIALLLNPFVALLQRRRVPRGLAVLIVYGVLILALA